MDNKITDTYIVGVGLSAGGLDALYALFQNPIPANASFVIIQHLPQEYKSNLASMLAARTRHEIREIENNMPVEANSVYVMTERKNIVLKNGAFSTTDLGDKDPNHLVDGFLHSLAGEKRDKSIAIILSGANDDGTKGAEAIKNAGGMVIAQDPGTAQFDVMPASVIASGSAHAVLAPENMMDELDRYIRQGILINRFMADGEAALMEVFDLIRNHTPLDFGNYKRATIVRRIARRLVHHDIGSLSEYVLFLKESPAEIDILSKEFMIRVTRFFRDSPAFGILKEKTIPDIIADKPSGGTLKIWTVGCATGEEAYSIAMLVHEHLADVNKQLDIKIFASDIDQKSLAVASKGIYPESIAQDVSEERISRFFHRENQSYRIKEHIRNMMIFAEHDVTRHPPYCKLDLISCRNVLIYMNGELQKKVLATFYHCLNPEGYLFLGPSENIGEMKTKMSEADKKWRIFKNIAAAGDSEKWTFSPPRYLINPVPKTNAVPTSSRHKPKHDITDKINEAILQDFNYAGVAVDERFKIVQTFGEFNKYLMPKMFTFNLLDLLPKELAIATGTSVRKAIKRNKDIRLKGIDFQQNGHVRLVNLLIKPLYDNKSRQKLILVLFNEQQPERLKNEIVEDFEKEENTHRYIVDLEEELNEKEEKLKEAYEALEESNNNAQSYNEELLSGNEELQSTNEEVQSINEELQTVNSEYQAKIKELAELNNDLNNFFRSTFNSQIYVDRNLIIRKFTRQTLKQINLKESDVGRPIGDISTNFPALTLVEDIKETMESSLMNEKEVQTKEGDWYQMRITPYVRLPDNVGDGVIVTFNDITALKTAQKNLVRINEDHHTFIYSVSHDLNAPIANIAGVIALLGGIVDPANEEIKDMLGLLDISVNKLKGQVAELSDIVKIEKESLEENYQTIPINDLLEEVKLSIHGLMIRSNAKITVDFQVGGIPFSKKNLRSILTNLLTNAIKYRSPDRDPEIHIRTEKTDDCIILSVKDNGLGISGENQSKLFSLYKRVYREKDIEGTGVGLFLVKKMLENGAGRIEVESEEGKGSVFKTCFKI